MRFVLLILCAAFIVPYALAQDVMQQNLVDPTPQEILEQIESVEQSVEHPDDGNGIILKFQQQDTALNQTHEAALIKNIVEPYTATDIKQRINILSLAGGVNNATARRISLERALIVREFLKGLGVSSREINMFPMGNNGSTPENANTIHIHFAK